MLYFLLSTSGSSQEPAGRVRRAVEAVSVSQGKRKPSCAHSAAAQGGRTKAMMADSSLPDRQTDGLSAARHTRPYTAAAGSVWLTGRGTVRGLCLFQGRKVLPPSGGGPTCRPRHHQNAHSSQVLQGAQLGRGTAPQRRREDHHSEQGCPGTHGDDMTQDDSPLEGAVGQVW